MGHKINLRNYFLHKLFYTPQKIVDSFEKYLNKMDVFNMKKIIGIQGNICYEPIDISKEKLRILESENKFNNLKVNIHIESIYLK